MNQRNLSALVLAAALTACSMSVPPTPPATPADAPADTAAMPGSDRDAHGCIGSAGYTWCESTGKCERPWELASQQGFPNTRDAFDAHCAKPATP